MARLTYRPAAPEDQAALQKIFAQTSMQGTVRINSERTPDHFAGAAVQAEEPCVWGAFTSEGEAAGTFSAGKRKVWLGGKKVPMRYLADLRIAPSWRAGFILARGFQTIRDRILSDGEWAQTLILEDNAPALEHLQSRRTTLPQYQPAGRYLNWLLPSQNIRPGQFSVRIATREDLPAMQTLLNESSRRRDFSPVIDLARLGSPYLKNLALSDFLLAEKNGNIQGLLGIWDQSAFQRLRIAGYAPWLAFSRPFYNLFRPAIRLPNPGQTVPLLKTTALACAEDNPAILRSLLASALARSGKKLISLGLSEKDPLTPALHNLKARLHPGRHFLVGWTGEPPPWKEPFAFDSARI